MLSLPLCGAAADQQKYFFPPSSNSFVVVQNTICILAPPVKNLWYFPYFLISLLTQFLFSLQARVLNFWPLSLKELVTNFVLSPILIFCPVLIPGRWQIWGKWGQLFTGAAFGKRQQARALFSRKEQSAKIRRHLFKVWSQKNLCDSLRKSDWCSEGKNKWSTNSQKGVKSNIKFCHWLSRCIPWLKYKRRIWKDSKL